MTDRALVEVALKVDTTTWARQLAGFAKEVLPYAASYAVNGTLFAARDALRDEAKKVFDRPVAFSVKTAFGYNMARLDGGDLRGRIFTLHPIDRANPQVPPTPETLSAYAAARRFDIETGGIQIGGLTIRTDRDSQGLIDRAYALSLVDPAEPIVFKAVSGPVTIDAATMQAVAVAVGRHVRDAFVREGQALLAIAAGTVTTPEQVDAILELAA